MKILVFSFIMSFPLMSFGFRCDERAMYIKIRDKASSLCRNLGAEFSEAYASIPQPAAEGWRTSVFARCNNGQTFGGEAVYNDDGTRCLSYKVGFINSNRLY